MGRQQHQQQQQRLLKNHRLQPSSKLAGLLLLSFWCSFLLLLPVTASSSSSSSPLLEYFHKDTVEFWKQRFRIEMELQIKPALESDECQDELEEDCPSWASMGNCDSNPIYMHIHCQRSCHACPPAKDPSVLVHQNQWGEDQEIYNGYPQQVIQKRMGHYPDYDSILTVMAETQDYMMNQVYVDPYYANVKQICYNKHHWCSFWATIGRCDNNEQNMIKQCAPACQYCEMLDYNTRCPTDDLETLRKQSIWNQPGDLDDTFINILNNPYYQRVYKPIVYSKPKHIRLIQQPLVETNNDNETTTTTTLVAEIPERKTNNNNNNYNPIWSKMMDFYYTLRAKTTSMKNQMGVSIIQDGPWVVTLENFLTDKECDTLIELGNITGYKRSKDSGKRRADGSYGSKVSEGRTSTNAWCTRPQCHKNATTQIVINKMSNVTGFNDTHAEYLQLLRYEETQFYNYHHDYIKHHIDRSYGVRVLTLFMYLNNVDLGGGTEFSDIGLTIMPKKGKALLWPSVLNEEPDQKDFRTHHQALPVEAGLKFGANAWFHSRDFKDAYERGCI